MTLLVRKARDPQSVFRGVVVSQLSSSLTNILPLLAVLSGPDRDQFGKYVVFFLLAAFSVAIGRPFSSTIVSLELRQLGPEHANRLERSALLLVLPIGLVLGLCSGVLFAIVTSERIVDPLTLLLFFGTPLLIWHDVLRHCAIARKDSSSLLRLDVSWLLSVAVAMVVVAALGASAVYVIAV